ncbi:hypothetical protein ACLB2K_071618 [Fragaria x ananassa]
MTIKVMEKIMMLSMFDPVMDQNLYYVGMKNSNATFTSAMCNMLPVFGFVMAWIFRLENVEYRSPRGLAKVLGTLVTVVGAILLTMVKGPSLNLPWAKNHENNHSSQHTEVKGVAYYVMGLVVKKKGPVFYSAFNPLATLIVAILGSFVLAGQLYTGSLIGAVTIVGGLYLVLWGKGRDQPPSYSKDVINVEKPTGIPALDDPEV